jgi:hypothetical protein
VAPHRNARAQLHGLNLNTIAIGLMTVAAVIATGAATISKIEIRKRRAERKRQARKQQFGMINRISRKDQ